MFKKILLISTLLIFLVSCGGGGSGSNNNTNNLEELKTEAINKTKELIPQIASELSEDESNMINSIESEANNFRIKDFTPSTQTISFVRTEITIDNKTEITPNNIAEYYNYYGVIFSSASYPKLALYFFLKALENDPENSLYMSEVVALLTATGKMNDASVFADLSSQLGISEATANISVATYYELAGEDEKAQSLYEEAIEIDPKSPLIRQYFFQALSRYQSLSNELLNMRTEAMTYCNNTLNAALETLELDSKTEVYNFLNEKTNDSVAFASNMIGISAYTSQDYQIASETIRESTIADILTDWESKKDLIYNKFENKMNQSETELQSCVAGCSGTDSCICGCFNASAIDLSEFTNNNLKSEIMELLNNKTPSSIYGLNQFETIMLNYIMKNVASDDITSIVNLTKYTYYAYKLSCTNLAIDYISTLTPYYGTYTLADTLASIASGVSCSPPSPPEIPEKIKEDMEEEIDEEAGDDILSMVSGSICIGGDLLGGCLEVNNGVVTISVNSGPITLSGSRNIITGVGLGGSIGININTHLPYDIANISTEFKMNFDSHGNYVSTNAKVGATTYVDKIKKVHSYIYKD